MLKRRTVTVSHQVVDKTLALLLVLASVSCGSCTFKGLLTLGGNASSKQHIAVSSTGSNKFDGYIATKNNLRHVLNPTFENSLLLYASPFWRVFYLHRRHKSAQERTISSSFQGQPQLQL